MKSQKNTQKLYEETLAEVEKVSKICLHCGDFLEKHFKESDPIKWASAPNVAVEGYFCQQGDYSRRFKLNDMALVGLQNRLKILEWVLDQEETYVSIDDAIMPETIVATFSKNKPAKSFTLGSEPKELIDLVELDIFVDDLDEPYRGMLLSLSNKLPITLPGVMEEKVQLVCFAIFPSGAVYRNYHFLEEDFIRHADVDRFGDYLKQRINGEMVEEILNRYGRK